MSDNISSYKKISILFLLGLLGLITGLIFLPNAQLPDQYESPWRTVGVLGFFIFFYGSICSYGEKISQVIFKGHLEYYYPLALGTTFFIVISFVAGHLELLSYQYRPALIVFLCLGYLLSIDRYPCSNFRKVFAKKNLDTWLCLLPLIFIFLQYFLHSSKASGASDTLMYHLLGPRLWADAGQVYFNPSRPFAFQAWNWEYLYLIGQVLLGDKGGRGLVEGQIFCQWILLFIAMPGALLTAYSLLRNSGVKGIWIFLCLLAMLTSRSLMPTLTVAKSDWAVIFFVLAGAHCLFFTKKQQWPEWVLSGIFFGLALTIKPTALFSVMGLLAFFLFQQQRFATALRVLLTISIVCMPLLIRNAIATGNPFYPYLMGIFPAEGISQFTLDYFKMIGPNYFADWQTMSRNFYLLAIDSLLNPLIVILLPWLIVIKPSRGLLYLQVLLFALMTCLWFLFGQFILSFPRWMGPALLVFPVLVVLVTMELMSAYRLANKVNIPYRSFFTKALPFALSLLFMGWSFQLDHWKNFFFGPSPAKLLHSNHHSYGMAKAWARLEMQVGKRALLTSDNQLYYVSHLNIDALNEVPGLLEALKAQADKRQRVSILRKLGVHYLLHKVNPHVYWGWYALELDQLMAEYPQTVIFDGVNSKVIDLELLEAAMTEGQSSQK